MTHQTTFRSLFNIFPLLAVIIFSACSPKIYLPDRVNAPMLREAGEVKLTPSAKIQNNSASSKFSLSPSLDFGVSPIDHIGIIASYRSTSRYSNEEDWGVYNQQDSIHYSGNRAEFGAGYYSLFGSKGIFELYGGGGFGYMERTNLKGYQGGYHTDFYQFFLQPALGFYARDIMDLCGGLRFAYHKFNHFRSDSPEVRYMFTDPKTDIESGTFLMISPFVNVNVGYKYAKFNVQMGANFNIGNPQLLQGNLPFYVSLGATLGYAPRFK